MIKELYLASASPRRADLLRQIGLDFKIIPSNILEEDVVERTPAELVMQLALLKANQVAQSVTEGFVIGADTVVVLEGKILGKPSGTVAAVEMLALLSGKEHSVYTGLAVIELPEQKIKRDYVETKVKFRKLSKVEIEAYVATGEPFDKAGAYGIQSRGGVLIEEIHGCYFNVVGLPLSKLVMMFMEFGVFL